MKRGPKKRWKKLEDVEFFNDDPLHPLTQLMALNNSFFSLPDIYSPFFKHFASQDHPLGASRKWNVPSNAINFSTCTAIPYYQISWDLI